MVKINTNLKFDETQQFIHTYIHFGLGILGYPLHFKSNKKAHTLLIKNISSFTSNKKVQAHSLKDRF